MEITESEPSVDDDLPIQESKTPKKQSFGSESISASQLQKSSLTKSISIDSPGFLNQSPKLNNQNVTICPADPNEDSHSIHDVTMGPMLDQTTLKDPEDQSPTLTLPEANPARIFELQPGQQQDPNLFPFSLQKLPPKQAKKTDPYDVSVMVPYLIQRAQKGKCTEFFIKIA
jgi:hypothetical protein